MNISKKWKIPGVVMAVLACLAVGLLGSEPAQADVIVLQPGPEGEDAAAVGGHPDTAYGDSPVVNYGCYQGVDNMRPILRFDLSSVPPDFEFTKAKLTLTEFGSFDASHRYRVHVHRITEPWDEATATWYNRTATELWSTPGGSFAEEWGVSDEFTTMGGNGYQPVEFQIGDLVHAWLDGTYPNYGMLLMPETLYFSPGGSPTNNYGCFMTSDHDVAAYHPKLTIPEPSTVSLLLMGGLLLKRRRR